MAADPLRVQQDRSDLAITETDSGHRVDGTVSGGGKLLGSSARRPTSRAVPVLGNLMRLVIAVITGALLGMLAGLAASWISIPTTVMPGSVDHCCAALMVVPALFGSLAGGVAAYYRHRDRRRLEADFGKRAAPSQLRRRRRY